MNFRDNWGSILSLFFGILLFLGAVGQITNPDARLGGLVGGPVMVIGALLYRSAKRRKNTQTGSTLRVLLELIGLAMILFIAFGQNDLNQRIIADPVPNLVIPVWALIAYACAVYRAVVARHATEVRE